MADSPPPRSIRAHCTTRTAARGAALPRRRVLGAGLHAALRMGGAEALLTPPIARAAPPVRWPALDLRTTAGGPVMPDSGDWRATYVDFWASWCTPCRLSFPWMNQMHERWSGAGLRVVAINLDRQEADARRFLQQHPARFEIALDPAAGSARLMDVQAMPTSFIVVRDGAVRFMHKGFRLEDRDALEQRLREALT